MVNFNLSPGQICLLTDDGSPLTTELGQTLSQQGVKVVVLSLSPTTPQASLPDGISRVVLNDYTEEHLQEQLSAIAIKYGTIAAFVHLHPTFTQAEDKETLYSQAETAMLKQVFFIAKHLKKSLTEAAKTGSSYFLSVAHLDGKLGLGSNSNSAIAGGLFGLTKSLQWEWHSVFCRAVDISPELDLTQAVQHIFAELQDPNRLLTEVGYSNQGRVTLTC